MLFSNTLAQSARLVTGYAFSFLLAPLMLARLGLEAYGIWAVTGALATYAITLDLGVGRSLSRFVAFYDARHDDREIRECLTLGVIATVLVGGLAVVLALALAPLVADLLDVPRVGELRLVLVCSAVILTSQGFVQTFDALGIGLRRMIPPNAAAVFGNCVNAAASLGALLASTELTTYAVANAAAWAFAVIPAIAAAHFVWRRGPLLALPRRDTVRAVLGYGLKNQVAFIADLVNFSTDKVIIAAIIDVRAAAAFDIGARVASVARDTAQLSISAMIPTMTATLVEHGREVVRPHVVTYTRRTVALAYPLFAACAATAPVLLVAWLDRTPARSTQTIVGLALAYAVFFTPQVASTTAMAAGEAGMVARNAVLAAVLNIALTAALAPIFGFWGVLAGTFAALGAVALRFIVLFSRRFELSYTTVLSAAAGPAAVAAALGLVTAVVTQLAGTPSGRAEAVPLLVGLGALFFVPYWVVTSRLGWLPSRLSAPGIRPRAREVVG